MRRAHVLFAIAVALAATPRPAAAWGFEGHKFITARAIALLPVEIRPFFQKYEAPIVEHSIDPDLWRTVGWLDEPPRHFVDMDAYGPYPFKDLPRDFDEAVKRRGLEFVVRNGTLPWRGEEIYRKLVEAFTQKAPYSRENIKLFASVVSHYTADAHVPFHAALNHDGQLTQQWGIHSRFETDLFDRFGSTLQLSPQAPAPVGNPRDFLFDTLTASFTFVQPVLEADKAAAAGRDVYDDAYFTMFFGKVRPILEQRLSASIQDVASIITAAWVEAGRPALSLTVQNPPKKLRKS
jgi:Zinc dependent phospholipase C